MELIFILVAISILCCYCEKVVNNGFNDEANPLSQNHTDLIRQKRRMEHRRRVKQRKEMIKFQVGRPVYTLGPRGSQPVPPILFMTMLMGKIHDPGDGNGLVPVLRPYIRVTLESMKRNPEVDFALIYVVRNPDPLTGEASELAQLINAIDTHNIQLHILTYEQLSERVEERIGVSITFNESWGYKTTDFKPTYAHLFPELFQRKITLTGKPYKYWAYGDIDLVWGDFRSFAHLFNANYVAIRSRSSFISGVAQFFINEEWTKRLFFKQPAFIKLLQEFQHFALDEFMGYKESNMGLHYAGIHRILMKEIFKNNLEANVTFGIHERDRLFLEEIDARKWSGPVVWKDGKLLVLHETRAWPAMREILCFHRPGVKYNLRSITSPDVASDIETDMIRYGFLLPEWIPLTSRHICSKTLTYLGTATAGSLLSKLANYRPWDWNCIIQDLSATRSGPQNVTLSTKKASDKVPNPGTLVMMSITDSSFLDNPLFMKLITSSMARNPFVEFVITVVNITTKTDASLAAVNITHLQPNVRLQVLTADRWGQLLQEKLGISWESDVIGEWAHKLSNVKPALAVLFPHFTANESQYKWWGYHDVFTIWGNFTRFNGRMFELKSWLGAEERFKIFPNTLDSKRDSSKSIRPSVQHRNYGVSFRGTTTSAITVNNQVPITANLRPTLWIDHDVISASSTRTGPILWNDGTLTIVRSSANLTSSTEILAYFVTSNQHAFSPHELSSQAIAKEIVDDMLTFGYLLPDWIPLTTRHLCMSTATDMFVPLEGAYSKYQPYGRSCFAMNDTAQTDYGELEAKLNVPEY